MPFGQENDMPYGYRISWKSDERFSNATWFVIGCIILGAVGVGKLADFYLESDMRALELAKQANQNVETFWLALMREQWPRAQGYLSDKAVLALEQYAAQNNEVGAVGGLYLLRERVPEKWRSVDKIECGLKHRKDRKKAKSIFQIARARIGGTCKKKESWPDMSTGQLPFYVDLVEDRKNGGWKIATFVLQTIQGNIVVDEDKGVTMPPISKN